MINKAILMGRLTKDPEMRHTGTGKPVCSFTIAIDNGYGENRQTDFINCVAWRNTAEFINKYFTKGMRMLVTGSIQVRDYENSEGKKVYVTLNTLLFQDEFFDAVEFAKFFAPML